MNNKTALITGGSRGLGRDMALSLAKEGVNVLITYVKDEKSALEVVEEITAMGLRAKAFQYNANHTTSGVSLAKNVVEYQKQTTGSGNLDYLINNAGAGTYNLIAYTSEQQLDDMYHIHYKSVYLLTQAFLPVLNDGGRIINISSGLTRFSLPGMSAYAIMKGAVEVFTRYLAKELGDRKITANVVAPGAIATDFAGGSNKQEDKVALISSITALGRVGESEDIGGVVAFLCSDKGGWINGQRIEVSGGMML